MAMAAFTSIDLSLYVRVGRYDLPEPTRTALPSGTPAWNLLAQEASAITYNKDTDTLFVLGDGGTALVEVSKTGQLLSTMTLAKGSSPREVRASNRWEGLGAMGQVGTAIHAEPGQSRGPPPKENRPWADGAQGPRQNADAAPEPCPGSPGPRPHPGAALGVASSPLPTGSSG